MKNIIIPIIGVTVCLTCAVFLWDAGHDYLAAAATLVAVVCACLSSEDKKETAQ